MKYRSEKSVVESRLWPNQGICPDPEASARYRAIANVLMRLPMEPYQRLRRTADEFSGFIPDEGVRGHITHFPPVWKTVDWKEKPVRVARILFLSAELERASSDIVVAIVAHELAHLILNHKIFGMSREEYDAQEQEAFGQLCAWGFEQEAKKHRATNRARDTRIRSSNERAKRELKELFKRQQPDRASV
jgi:hypothetical protein